MRLEKNLIRKLLDQRVTLVYFYMVIVHHKIVRLERMSDWRECQIRENVGLERMSDWRECRTGEVSDWRGFTVHTEYVHIVSFEIF